ncbi:MAG: metal ABC transporter permease [Gammaproteobacteria bacterium]|nr:metal ABC transporter permease [Gammaproteobacteria bacterium]MDH5734517.1 metal ABC transporter permease [Gammaproteobacteria bacterium]
MMDDFIIRAIVAGLLVVLVSGPLGCVVVWRRMAYFGDTLAHSALLGAALGIMFEVDPVISVIFLGALFSTLLVVMQRNPQLSNDALLGIIAHGALALGLVLLALLQNQGMRVDLISYLLGDILAVTNNELIWMTVLVLLVAVSLSYLWKSLLSIAVHEELARSEGIAVDRVRLSFMVLMALVVAVAMKVVGILLITALLIIPAASARRFAHSPQAMALISIVFGVIAVVSGLFASMQWDSPAGPSIVVAAVMLFFVTRIKLART